MESYSFLLFLAIIMISTKILGLFTRKIHMPAVVGALVAGVILGPSCLNLITLTGDTGVFLEQMAELGVILLMFNAGLETDLSELKKNGVASFVTALIGVIVPLIGGFLGYAFFFHTDFSDYDEVLKAVFVGVVLTATSVSITVETLREMGKLKGKVGTTILGAAVIDDIIGIIVLTIVTSLKDTSVSPITVVLKIVLNFVFIAVLIFVLTKLKVFVEEQDEKRRTAIICVALCFILSISQRNTGIGRYYRCLLRTDALHDESWTVCCKKMRDPVLPDFHRVFFVSVGLGNTRRNGCQHLDLRNHSACYRHLKQGCRMRTGCKDMRMYRKGSVPVVPYRYDFEVRLH